MHVVQEAGGLPLRGSFVAALALLPLFSLYPQSVITLRAGATAQTQVAPGTSVSIPLVIDMTAAGGTNLGALTTNVAWNNNRLTFDSVRTVGFGTLTSNISTAASGTAAFSIFDASGTTSTVTMANIYFTASESSGGTTVALTPTVAGSDIGTRITSMVRVRNLDVCVAPTGVWGDVNADADVNIIDAQQIARFSVGLVVANVAAVTSRGDVNADLSVNVIDAQQIARFSVALSAVARIKQALYVPPAVASMVLTPSSASQNLTVGNTLLLIAEPRDVTGGSLAGCQSVTWASSNAAVATVSVTGLVTAVAGGTATITATSGGQSASVAFTSVPGSIAIAAGDGQVLLVNGGSLGPLTVLVKDGADAPLAGTSVTFTVASGGALVNAGSSQVVLTDAGGLASVRLTAPATSGAAIAVTAQVLGLTPVTFNARTVPSPGIDTRCELNAAGAAYCWGVNSHGQIGDGTLVSKNVPTAVGGGLVFSSLADGSGDHACGLTAVGAAYCWGSNVFGELGDGTTIDRLAPVAVTGGITFTTLALSGGSTCGVSPAGATYCWGWASWGFGGDGVFGTARTAPTLVNTGGSAFTKLSLSLSTLCGIATSGGVYCWGYNGWGSIGNGTTNNASVPTPLSDGRTYVDLSLGNAHACGVTATGDAFCWGNNGYGQLGTGNGTTQLVPSAVAGGFKFVSISASNVHTCAIQSVTGAAWCWGNGLSGQLGDGTLVPRSTPGRVMGGLQFTAVRSRLATICGRAVGGQPYCWGFGATGQLGDGTNSQATTPTPAKWVDGTAGVAVSMVYNNGFAFSGIAGLGLTSLPSVKVRDFANNPVSGATVGWTVTAGGGSVAAATSLTDVNGIATSPAWTLGLTAGVPNALTASATGTPTLAFSASAASPPASVAMVSGNEQYNDGGGTYAPIVVAVRDNANQPLAGVAVTFASGAAGNRFNNIGTASVVVNTDAVGIASVTWSIAGSALGVQSATATVAGLSPVTFSAVRTNNTYGYLRCERTSIGQAYCWGFNYNAGVGDGTTAFRSTPVAVSGAMTFASLSTGGGDHACGITAAGAAYCWGYNGFGELGDASTTTRLAPVAVSGGLTFSKIEVNPETTCGLTTGGAIYCWGWAHGGMFGDGSLGIARRTPTVVPTGALSFTDLTVGADHACAVATSGDIYCWGENSYGALGDGTTQNRATPTRVNDTRQFAKVTAGAWHSCALSNAGSAFCWGGMTPTAGDGTATQRLLPTQVTGGLTFVAIDAGSFSTCGLTFTVQIWCWGDNTNGELGDGTTISRLAPVAVVGGLSFANLELAYRNACAKTVAGQPFCWGWNLTAALGNGNTASSSSPTPATWVEGTPGTPVSVILSSGTGQTARIGTAVLVPPAVIVRDYANNPIAGVTVTFTVTSGGGGVAGSSAVSEANGIATVGSWTLGTALGANSLIASISGVGTVVFAATASP